jgi:hypothetical protein
LLEFKQEIDKKFKVSKLNKAYCFPRVSKQTVEYDNRNQPPSNLQPRILNVKENDGRCEDAVAEEWLSAVVKKPSVDRAQIFNQLRQQPTTASTGSDATSKWTKPFHAAIDLEEETPVASMNGFFSI